MELIKFDDRCTVRRSSGEYDEWDNPVETEVYSDRCRYQQGVQAYMGISQRNSVIFMEGTVLLSENDTVSVTLASSGVDRGGTVKTVRHIEMPLTHKKATRIEIIHDTEKINQNTEKNG